MQPCTTPTIRSEATIIPPGGEVGILASVVIAVTFWFWATTVHYCTTSVGDNERPAIICEKDALAIFLIEQKT
jgi:hypothetical protein